MQIEIFDRWAGKILYAGEHANLRAAVIAAVKFKDADLSRANLSRADLSRAKGVNPFRCTPLLMLHDQPGKQRAYKIVEANGYGIYRGPTEGGICYKIGCSYEVADANCYVGEPCGAGINLATLDWCIKEWVPGRRILYAEFTRADIAAIPTGTDGKFRVKKCKIVGEKDLVEIGLVTTEATTEATTDE